jgi:hypothetical protein
MLDVAKARIPLNRQDIYHSIAATVVIATVVVAWLQVWLSVY